MQKSAYRFSPTYQTFSKSSFENVAALIGYNCATNLLIARKLKKLLNGCASHRFQLYVREVIADKKDAIYEFYGLMVKLCKSLMRINFYNYTHL